MSINAWGILIPTPTYTSQPPYLPYSAVLQKGNWGDEFLPRLSRNLSVRYVKNHRPLRIVYSQCGSQFLESWLTNFAMLSHFGAMETNLYKEVKHKVKDPFEVHWPCTRKLRKSLSFYRLCFYRLWCLRKLSLFHHCNYNYHFSISFVF